MKFNQHHYIWRILQVLLISGNVAISLEAAKKITEQQTLGISGFIKMSEGNVSIENDIVLKTGSYHLENEIKT